MSDVVVRPARIEEIDTLLEFEQGIVKAERPFDPTLKDGEIHYYDLRELTLSAEAEVAVALIDGEIVGSGYALIKKAEDFLKHEHYAHLGFMYVKPEHRGKAIIKQILESLRKWAIDQGVTEMRLQVYSENAAAIKAYEKAGFKPHMLKMRMEVNR
ncbi:MAG: GNAT family N-acetyltransferase [Pyrinomonadaceae bacterium]